MENRRIERFLYVNGVTVTDAAKVSKYIVDRAGVTGAYDGIGLNLRNSEVADLVIACSTQRWSYSPGAAPPSGDQIRAAVRAIVDTLDPRLATPTGQRGR